MSEQQQPQHERKESLKPAETSGEQLRQHHEREAHKAEKGHGSEEQLSKILEKVDKHSRESEKVTVAEHKPQKQHPVLINKQLKDMAFSRAMVRTRKKLSAPGRAFSKLIHTTAVDRSSEFIGKTVARPTSMFWGAFFAFVGTSALLWITRHYGYEYNYLLAIMLFVLGAVVGLVGEGLWRAVRKKEQ